MKSLHVSVRTVPFLAVFLVLKIASAQVSTGTPPFGSLGGGPFDVVNLGNLNVHLSIPILHKAGRGVPFSYDLSYDSSLWYAVTVNGQLKWQPTANWGWTSRSLAVLGYLRTNDTPSVKSIKCTNGGFATQETDTLTYAYVDSAGRSHPFPGSTYSITNNCNGAISYGPTLTAQATDGSGYSLKAPANESGDTVTTRSGVLVYTNVGSNGGSGTYQDSNGNQLTVNNSTGQFFDTLSSSTAVLTQAGSGTPTSPVTYTYAAPSGSAAYTVKYAAYTVKTNFGFSTIGEYGPTANNLVSEIDLPDGTKYTLQYEATPGYSGDVTGRLASVTLPTGGTITYIYSGGTNGTGIYSDGSTAGLNRILAASTTCNSANGCWQYTRGLVSGTPGPGSTWQTTVIDPNSNYTVINFAEDGATGQVATWNFYETQGQAYQGSVSPSNLLTTTIKCYNNNYTNCSTATVSSPITQTDFYSQLPNGNTRLSETIYNGFGLVTDDKEYDYGVSTGSAPGTAHLVRETATTYASLGNGIVDHPGSVVVYDWTSGTSKTVASTIYTYDGSTPVSPAGTTPQHISITGSRGNLTTIATQVNSSTTLYRKFTYYDTGKVQTATDAGATNSGGPNVTTYNYPDATSTCGNAFATSVALPILGTTPSPAYNCNGAVATTTKDLNGNATNVSYSDPAYWRPASSTDPLSNLTNFAYTSTSFEKWLTFGSSIVEAFTMTDGFGRNTLSQRQQNTWPSNFDTVSRTYDPVGRVASVSMPCSAAWKSGCPSTPVTSITYDALNRPTQTTDGAGGSITYSYTNNDVLQTISPPATGENTKRRQFEYDGLGRLTSVCEITSGSGSGSCGQTVLQTGYWTRYNYDVLGHLVGVTQNAQSGAQQARTYSFDMLGRLTSETNPESGTTSYVYDSGSGVGCAPNSPGDLLKKTDANGNWICYAYDALHRLTDVGNSNQSATNPCHRYRYDNTSGVLGTRPTGVTLNNTLSQLAEAETDNCSAWPVTQASMITDDWFSYTARGENSDIWESTQHSGGYYHITAAYWPHGALQSLNSNFSGVPSQTYGVDSEGRLSSVSAGSGQSPVSSTTYNVASQTTRINYGSGDYDTFSYDSNTGRMIQDAYVVGTQSIVGNLTWNQNGSLGQLAITDPFNSANTQTCTYVHDDLSRVASVSCGSIWSQNFTYDAFGNITKTGSSAWQPGYNSSTNRYTLGGTTYDADGHLLTDTINSYTWDVYGNPASVNGQSLVYDALGRMVEKSGSEQFVYAPGSSQVFATMNGQTPALVLYPLTGGATAMYFGSDGPYYTRPDWLGSARVNTTRTQTVAADTAYAPFGEQYSTSGNSWYLFASSGHQWTLTGNTGLDDFPFRKYSPGQGRWISPDPAGLGAVDRTNPQTWNRYAYVGNNPLALADPLGLQAAYAQCWNCGGGGGGVNGGNCTTNADGWTYSCGGQVDLGGGGGGAGCDASGDCQAGVGPPQLPVFAQQESLYETCTVSGVDCYGSSASLDSNGNPTAIWVTCSGTFTGLVNITSLYCGVPKQAIAGSSPYEYHAPIDWMGAVFGPQAAGTWNSAASWGKLATGYLAGTTLLAGGAVAVDSLPYMNVIVGPGSPFHVAYGVDGTWLNASGEFFNMTVEDASSYARAAARYGWPQFSVTVLNPSAVLATEGASAWSCVTAACSAFLAGWGF